MVKPDKFTYGFAKVDYGITLFVGLLSAAAGALIGMIMGAIVHGIPARPEEIGIGWMLIPIVPCYFIPLLWDMIATNSMNESKQKKYASDMAAYNSYVESQQKRELETFIKECKQ